MFTKLTNLNAANRPTKQSEAIYVRSKHLNKLIDELEGSSYAADSIAVDTITTNTESALTLPAVLKNMEESDSRHLTAADSGKVFFLNSDTGAVTYTLPAPIPGLTFKWVFVDNKTSVTNIATADVTDTTGDMFRGGLLVCAAAAVNTFVEASGDVNTIVLDDDVVNGAAGTGSWVEVICTEDTKWFVHGVINSTTDADGVGSAIFVDTDA